MSSNYVLVEPAVKSSQDIVTDSHDSPVAVIAPIVEGVFESREKAEQRINEAYGKQHIVAIPEGQFNG